jgi:hypothetical protein
MIGFWSVALCLLVPATIGATDEPLGPLVGDRPDFTESAETIARGHVQLEAGTTFEASDGDVDAFSFGELLIRIGLSRSWELRVGPGSYVQIDSPTLNVSGVRNPSIEAKFRFNPASEGVAVALLFGTTVPVGYSNIGSDKATPFAKLLLGHDFRGRLSLGANVGYARPFLEETRSDLFDASLSLGVAVSERIGTYVELFGLSEESRGGPPASFFDAGMTYLLNPNLQLDARIGRGLGGTELGLFAGIGVIKRW